MQKTGWTRVGAVVLLTLGMIYVVKLADLGIETYRAFVAEQDLEQQVELLDRQTAALETAAVDASSDAYVEEYARGEIGLAQPGDQVFVPVEADEMPQPAPAEAPAAPSAWQRFLTWVRGESDSAKADAEAPKATATSSP